MTTPKQDSEVEEKHMYTEPAGTFFHDVEASQTHHRRGSLSLKDEKSKELYPLRSFPNGVNGQDTFSMEEDIQDEDEGEVQNAEVKRELKQRHIGMIALGGTIGTGLFIGLSTPLTNAGPVGALISYLFMGSLAYSVTQSLGEMATFIPVTSSFTVFSQRFLSPAFGCLLYTSRCV